MCASEEGSPVTLLYSIKLKLNFTFSFMNINHNNSHLNGLYVVRYNIREKASRYLVTVGRKKTPF